MGTGRKDHDETLNVGVLIDSVDNHFNLRVVSGLLASAEELGIRLVMYVGGSLDRDMATGNYSWIYSLPKGETIRALIVLPHSIAPWNPDTAVRALLSALPPIPVYSLFSRLDGCYSVDCDETSAIENMLRHLTDYHGYRRFAAVFGPLAQNTLAQRRLERISAFLSDSERELSEDFIFSGALSAETGKQGVQTILTRGGNSPEVLLCMGDSLTVGAIAELQGLGISVPEDIAVVSFDEVSEAENLPCSLSTVSLPLASMLRLLLERVHTDCLGKTQFSPDYVTLPARFMHRESCGCISWNEREIAKDGGFEPLDQTEYDDDDLKRAALIRHGLDQAVTRSLSRNDPAVFREFMDETLHSLRNHGEVPSVILDVFSTQWTIHLLRQTDTGLQTFINTLFIDAFRMFLQAKVDSFKRIRNRDLGALEFYKNGNELLAEKKTLHASLVGIGQNIPALGVDRAQIILICPYNPELGEVRLDYRVGGHLDIPEGNFRTIPIENLLHEGGQRCSSPLIVLCLAHGKATFGYLTLAVSEYQFEQYGLVQETLSHIIEAALTNDELSAHIRKLTRNNDTLSKISLIDEFTGLYNRRALYAVGKTRFEQAHAAGLSSCFIFIDLDGLKKINDTWGHREGDAAIRTFAEAIRKSFRENDVLVRYGGDEFIVIMTDIARETLDKALARVSKYIAKVNERGEHPWTLSASWGFVFTPPGSERKEFEAVIEESDINLYQQKRKKREAL